MDIPELTRIGYDEVPHVRNNLYQRNLIFTIVGLLIILAFIVVFLVKLINALIKEKTQSELLRQKEHFLYTDSLTELHNRNYFDSKIKNSLDSRQYPQTLIVADMNNLKTVNDNFGHNMGDELLKQFADALIKCIPEDSIAIRLGGDEFLIIIENTDEESAKRLIDSIKESALKKEIQINDKVKVKLEAALGHATRFSCDIGFDALFKIADERMYENKKKSHTN
jgi:diguanylate cyclase (GGDEF)-like protein